MLKSNLLMTPESPYSRYVEQKWFFRSFKGSNIELLAL